MRCTLNRIQDDTKGILSSIVVTGKKGNPFKAEKIISQSQDYKSTGIIQQSSVTVLMHKICKYYCAK